MKSKSEVICTTQFGCDRCGRMMSARVHDEKWIPPRDGGWYEFWFQCDNPECVTTKVMPNDGYRYTKQHREAYMEACNLTDRDPLFDLFDE